MKQALVLGLLPLVKFAFAQGVTDKIYPNTTADTSKCVGDLDGTFVLTSKYVDDVVANTNTDSDDDDSDDDSGNSTAKFKRVKRDDTALLTCTIKGDQLFDADGRTGYIASSRQFQFDAPPQNGSIYTAGFSICDDDKLNLGNQSVWWACDSESYANIYDSKFASYCVGIYLYARNPDANATDSNADATATGNATATGTATGIVLAPVASDEAPVTQIDNGQIEEPAKYPYTVTPTEAPAPAPTETAANGGADDSGDAGEGGDAGDGGDTGAGGDGGEGDNGNDGGDDGGDGADDGGDGADDGGDGGDDGNGGDDGGDGGDNGGEGGDDDKQPPDFAGTATAIRIPVAAILAGFFAVLAWL